MFHIIYKDHGIDILKCSECKSYDVDLVKSKNQTDPQWSVFKFSCLNCGKIGKFRLSTTVELENFDSWDELQDRIEELKVIMGFKGL